MTNRAVRGAVTAALILAGLAITVRVASPQAISNPSNPTNNPNQINVTTSYLYLNKLHYAGTWSSTVTYNSQDVVFYSSATYISLQVANLNENPASATLYWIVVPGSGGGGSAAWGGITGTLSNQTDLNTALGLALAKASNLSDLGSASTARTNLGLGNVQNTALTTWAGSTSLVTLGTIATGTWNGAAIGLTYLPTIPASQTSGFAAVATSGSASSLTTGTLPHAQLPTLLSADVPNNAANTSGNAANVTGIVAPANGGTGVANTATDTLGTSNQNWPALGTGIVKNTTTTGALSNAASSDVYGLWLGTCSITTFLRGDGTCAAPSGSTPAVSAIIAAAAGNTIANGVFAQVWNWALAGSTIGMTFGETTAATGTGNSIVGISTLSGSTATPLSVSAANLLITSTPGISILNNTAAAAGSSTQQYSPYLVIGGQGWKTATTAASQPVTWQFNTIPVQGSTAPTEQLYIAPWINGAAAGASAGVVFASNTSTTVPAIGFRGTADVVTGIGQGASGTFDLISSSVDQLHISGSGLTQAAAVTLGWASTTLTSSSTCDTCLTRFAAATFQHGAADAAAPVAQTERAQSVVAGTTNTAGVLYALEGSAGTGTGAGGDIALKTAPAGSTGSTQNAFVTTFDINSGAWYQAVVATAKLPACTASTGPAWRGNVSDATTPAVGSALTGGGAVFATVHCSLTSGTYLVDGL